MNCSKKRLMKVGMINNDMVNMKEISKCSIVKILFCFMLMTFISCEMSSIVSFENDDFDKMQKGEIKGSELPDVFYYTRVTATVWVDLIFMKFSKNDDFSDIDVRNISIKDDKGNDILLFPDMHLQASGIINTLDNINYEIYSFEIDNEENRTRLKNYETKFIIFTFEIDGKQYSQKLKRVEEKYTVFFFRV